MTVISNFRWKLTLPRCRSLYKELFSWMQLMRRTHWGWIPEQLKKQGVTIASRRPWRHKHSVNEIAFVERRWEGLPTWDEDWPGYKVEKIELSMAIPPDYDPLQSCFLSICCLCQLFKFLTRASAEGSIPWLYSTLFFGDSTFTCKATNTHAGRLKNGWIYL